MLSIIIESLERNMPDTTMNTLNPDLPLGMQKSALKTWLRALRRPRRWRRHAILQLHHGNSAPKSFQALVRHEALQQRTDPQEHMDAFKLRMALAGVLDPVKCQAFPITLKKATLKWFNSLPPRSIKSILRSFFTIFGSLHY